MFEPTRVYRDPSGRVVIEEKDDRDTPYAIIIPQPASVLGIAAFSELVRIPMERARRGQLFLSAQIVLSGFTGQFVAIEVNIVGYIASAPTVILASALDNNISLLDFSWDVPDSYSAIGIEARQIVDGVASGTTTGISTLNFSVAGTYWR